MLEYCGMLIWSSVHNQRVECMWKDMHQSVTKLFYRLFYFLEEMRWLDPTNDIHMYSLHYVYIPRINCALTLFKTGWNKHGIRTEHASSPEQLFVAGALRLRNSGMVAVDFFDNVQIDSYGVDEEGLGIDDDDGAIVIPENTFGLTEEQFLELQQQVNPLDASENHGIKLYKHTIQFIINL